MNRWGRAGLLDTSTMRPPTRRGRRSLICAVIATAIAAADLGAFFELPLGQSAVVNDLATAVFLILFFVVAPAISLFGLLSGVIVFFRPDDSRWLAAIGIVFNAGLLAVWAYVGYAAMFG